MIFSYLGLSDPINYINNYFQQKICKHRKLNSALPAPLECGGVFSSDLNQSTVFASENDMGVFLNPADLFEKSDIVFVFLPDNAVKNLASSLRGHGITNKIIIHFSKVYGSEILDFDPSNTYISIYLPYYTKDVTDDKLIFYIEGYGNRFDDFLYCLRMMEVTPVTMSYDEKALLISSISLKKDLIDAANEISNSFITASFKDKPIIAQMLRQGLDGKDICLNTYSASKIGNISYINEQTELAENYGIGYAKAFIGSLLLFNAHKTQDEEKSNALKIYSKSLLTDKKNFG